MTEPTWTPDPQAAAETRMAHFHAAASRRAGRALGDSVAVQQWALEELDAFWSLVWDEFGVVGERGPVAHVPTTLPQAVFFPDARINLAENLLAPWADSDAPAVVWVGEGDDGLELREVVSGRELRRRVGSFARRLRARGVSAGDRVGLVLPVGPDALVCTLGALAVGAVVSSVSPEFGAPAILDRLGQLAPTVLVAAPSYRWNGKRFHRAENVAEVAVGLPSLTWVALAAEDLDDVIVDAIPEGCGVETLAGALDEDVQPEFARLPFDHPAYVLFSSGTTGKPKCLIHRGGGVLLKHLVEVGLHADVRPGDRMLFYTTTSWMMWNWEISTLALGATLVLHDGAPTYPGAAALFDSARLTGATHLGMGARLLDHMRAEGVGLREHVGADAPLRQVLVTGSPLSVPTAHWLAEQLGPAVMINPISGGTDLVGVFVGGDPTRPFHAGEMAGPTLGTAVDVYADEGVRAVDGEPGELVCLQPFPTVPVGIWGDPSGERLRSAYFDVWPGIWVHGDRSVRSEHGGIAILGRSDATLNVAGVRIGTAEIYAALAEHPAVADCLAFGQEWDGDTRIVLLVVPTAGTALDEDVQASIRTSIRRACSPRHVPAVIVAVSDLPRTQTGKISEIAVREAVHGREVKGLSALANPSSLDEIVAAVPR
ncbi:MAG: acetoacetate--CoA ligase [Actinomycetales bacterium]|nr:acetoacetate--CoA ligase [Actinomycetales bacterium]